MNYIKHLAGFFDRIAIDERLNPTHVSLYVSLFQFWNASRFQNPISISRNELMKVSKISAKATYHKCMKELNEWQYLKYKPSYNPFKGSLVYLFNFQSGEIEKFEAPNLFSNEMSSQNKLTKKANSPIPKSKNNQTNWQTGSKQALVAHHTKIETSVEQAQEPYININKQYKQNIKNLDKQTKKLAVQKLNGLEKKEKSSAKKERSVISNDSEKSHQFKEPNLKQVQKYFASQKFDAIEAEKFYNYFQSNGWLVGGKTKMKDWQAAARNWMLNSKRFSNSPPLEGQGVGKKPSAKNLHTKHNKNYNEPL